MATQTDTVALISREIENFESQAKSLPKGDIRAQLIRLEVIWSMISFALGCFGILSSNLRAYFRSNAFVIYSRITSGYESERLFRKFE